MTYPPLGGESGANQSGLGPAGTIVAPTPVVLGTTSTVPTPPFPTGPVPNLQHWVVLLNASPFTIIVASGRTVTQIAAFTSDAVQVVLTNPNEGPTITPVAGSGSIETGTDSNVYATWYEGQPPGTYPAAIGAGNTPVSQSTALLSSVVAFANPAPSFQSFLLTNLVQPWMQAIAIRFIQSAGTADSFVVSVQPNLILDDTVNTIVGMQQWLYVPIQGQDVSVVVNNMTAGVPGGTFNGTIEVWGLAGPIIEPTLGQPTRAVDSALQVGRGYNVNVALGALAANVTAIQRPPPGTMIVVRSVHWRQTIAPAAGADVEVLGLTSGTVYVRVCDVTVVGGQWSGEVWVGNTSAVLPRDPAEGVKLTSFVNQVITVGIAYDVVPVRWD